MAADYPGISWGPDKPVNLIRIGEITYIAVFCHASPPTIIRTFFVHDWYEHEQMLLLLHQYNYNTCRVCEEVLKAMDSEK